MLYFTCVKQTLHVTGYLVLKILVSGDCGIIRNIGVVIN